MRKFIKTILLSFLAINLTFTSFASEDQPAKEGTDQKAGEKIIITESVNPIKNPQETSKETESTRTNKEVKPDGKNDKSASEQPKDESAFREKKQSKSPSTEETGEKNANPDMERIEKVVDDLVLKLDKNSNLSKALSDIEPSINTDNKDGKKPNEASKQTEAIIKDYNKKIQSATNDNQRKKLENEAADRINSINSQETSPARVENEKESGQEDIPEKKKKILLEVKPDNSESEDEDERGQILALNPTNDSYVERKSVFSNPIIIIALVLLVVILVVIGIVIRNNDRKMK